MTLAPFSPTTVQGKMLATFLCFLLLNLALPSRAAEPEMFRFSKDIQSSANDEEAILAVAFDSDVYAATRDRFPDLRIFNAENQETPFVVEKATEPRMRTVRTTCGSTVTALDEHENDLDILLRLDDRAPAADGLSIMTPLTNFERRVLVYGSDDAVTWTPLVDAGLVFDYSRYMDISNREVRLPKNNYRHLKVRIEGIADSKESPFLDLTRKYRGGHEAERVENIVLQRRPFRMDSIELWRERQEKLSENQRKIDYKVAKFHVEENPDNKTTIVYVTMRREPLTEFALETASRNFNRSAVVQTPVMRAGRTEWIDVGRGQVSRVDFAGYRKETLDLFFPERRETTYRIVIHNEDSPPLAITGAEARGNVYRALFLAAPVDRYRLCYGSDEIEAPKYDAAMVLAPLRQSHATAEGQLGAEIASAVEGESHVFSLRDLFRSRVFLGTVVAVLVVLLGWALYHASKRISELPRG